MTVLGIDTSNYTTSAAILRGGEIIQQKAPLPVAAGEVGLRQSDAVFAHVKQLGPVLEQLFAKTPDDTIEAVGVSVSPRDEAGSYMPCFLAGQMAARVVAVAMRVPLYEFSHQAGHIAAALFSAGEMELFDREFIAFHVSGGTTECVRVMPGKPGGKPFSVITVARSLDLHAGQLIDRVGAMLGLPFPAGPALETLAEKSKRDFHVKTAFKGMDCCLSGVENQCRKLLDGGVPPEDAARFCLLSIGAAVLEMTRLVTSEYPALPLVYAGGVMANKQIRAMLLKHFEASFAEPALSADNAAGIAVLSAKTHGNFLFS